MITRLLLLSAPILGFTTASGPLRPVINLLLVVFLVFGCVWLFLEIRRNLVADLVPAPGPATAFPAPAPLPEVIPDAVVAVIGAAVHHVFNARARVVSIAPAPQPPAAVPFPWSAEGRRSHYSSHKVR